MRMGIPQKGGRDKRTNRIKHLRLLPDSAAEEIMRERLLELFEVGGYVTIKTDTGRSTTIQFTKIDTDDNSP